MSDWESILSPRSSQLFDPDESRLEVIQQTFDGTSHGKIYSFKNTERLANWSAVDISSTMITTCGQLQEHHKNTKSSTTYIYIIRQAHTWGHMKITKELACMLLSLYDVCHRFWECISCFGYRENDDDNVWEGIHTAVRERDSNDGIATDYELCYLFRYMTENGRATGSPWSLRQSAVYQSFELNDEKEIWILI
ncbi:hypothetical protein K491DRAFT_261195 [Lophiostoma macrostomum CBS 122681]|uniref:CorA-like transporter domain-containing protein n=1 Tax=Lophiostoma macrostomum CBS 122681 TaxID=1314788 RepID=A0A6A6SK33_9PLEO|nr:hypothetical protein K491DRAFT_261195 [Lophiostoma macrostomum CBS 122681]